VACRDLEGEATVLLAAKWVDLVGGDLYSRVGFIVRTY
jgi:hypothetical protein